MKKFLIRLVILLSLGGGVWGAIHYFRQLPEKQTTFATATVRKGDVVVRAFTRGELRAVRSVTLIAPNLFGTVQVTRLAPIGALSKEGDLIIEFDDSERRSALEETLLEVEQVDEQIKKAQADLDMRNNQDQVELLRARYSVRRAELEVQRNELLSDIDAKKNLLNLEEAKRRLQQLESDIESRKAQAEAELAVLREKRNKSLIDVAREKQRIATAKVLAPIGGLVSVRQNRSAFSTFGQQLPDIREGDILQPGMQVADVLDLSEMEVIAKVGELDRANLSEGQDVLLRLDAIPDQTFHGKIKNMSATATSNPFSGDPSKKFDVIFSVDMRELMTALGASESHIQRVLAMAEENRRKAAAAPPSFSMMAPMAAMGGPGGNEAGGFGGGAMAGGMPGGAPGGGMRGPGGGGRPQVSPEQRAQMFARMLQQLPAEARKALEKELKGRKLEDLGQSERQQIFAKLREMGGGRGGRGGDAASERARAERERIEEERREKAQLPAPPGEDSQLDVLLRPGLLADVEIIVDRVPDAIHIPAQAVFEKEGQLLVYVREGKRFEPRVIKPLKRSESVMIVNEGLEPGEVISLADPTADRSKKKKGEKAAPGGAAPTGGMPSRSRS
ncbi:MAG: efflux RND transporter periplasmic adaptor subunit [Bryobacterales bacterium]|nr:efflux RND transporter periplasmic adaptor subunit [Bryobacterales bacterium]